MDMKHELAVLPQLITWIAGPAGLLIAISSYAHQWRASYLRATGLILVLLGILLTVSSVGWLVEAKIVLSTNRGISLLVTAAAGLLLAGVGVTRAARAPVGTEVHPLRAISRAVEAQVNGLDEKDDVDGDRFVPPSLKRSPGIRQRRVPFSRWPDRIQGQLTVLTGDAGTGKTTALRQMTRQICQNAMSSRHPREMALYVDLAEFPESDEPINADSMHSYIKDTIARGDSTLAGHFTQYISEPRDRPTWFIIFDSFGKLVQRRDSEDAEQIGRNFLSATQQFLNSAGPNFRALIVTREQERPEYLRGPTLTLAPLSARQTRKMCQKAGLIPVVRRQLLHRLRNDPDLKSFADNPLLLRLLCDHLRGARHEDIPTTTYDIERAAIATRLQDNFAELEEITLIAEHIAKYMITATGRYQPSNIEELIMALQNDGLKKVSQLESAVHALTQARILQATSARGRAFALNRFQEYFATGWLLRSWEDARRGR